MDPASVAAKRGCLPEETMPKGMAVVALVLGLAINLVTPPVAAQTPPAPAQTPPAAAQTPPASEGAEQSPRGRAKQSREAARQARETMRVMAAFSGAAATYTDIVELTLTERMDAVRLRIAAARGDLARLRPLLADEAFEQLETRLGEVEAAYEKGDRTATALAALEGFRTIATSADPRMRRSPVDISMHAYFAFKISILAATPQIDWGAVRQAAKDSEKNWIAIRRFVRDANLRVLLSRIQSGLREAAARDDAASVKFAASLQLASVPVLQDFFSRIAEAMARGGKGDMSQMMQGR
jgi:hypothetical protein